MSTKKHLYVSNGTDCYAVHYREGVQVLLFLIPIQD